MTLARRFRLHDSCDGHGPGGSLVAGSAFTGAIACP